METNIQKAGRWLREAEALLVTASNGLSIAEGYHIFADNEDFRRYFGRFRDTYGIDCLIRGVFAPLPPVEHEVYMAAVHRYLIEDYHGSDVMKDLLAIIGNKDYMVVTSNGDTHFQMNGFDPERIFEVEGNFDGLAMHSGPWQEEQRRFDKFARDYSQRQLTVLELGIGKGNRLIKQPVMEMVESHPAWRYITLNMPAEILVPDSIADRSLALPGDIAATFAALREETDDDVL